MKLRSIFEDNPITMDYMQANPDPSKEMEEITDLGKYREQRKRVAANRGMDQVMDKLESFVDQLVAELVQSGLSEREAEKMIGSSMSNLVMAFDLQTN